MKLIYFDKGFLKLNKFQKTISGLSADYKKEEHPFHVVQPSYLPFFIAVFAFILTFSIALFFHELLHFKAVTFFLYAFFLWICEWAITVSKEGLQGHHTKAVLKGLKLGFILFIASEVMFFFSFFWAYFHFALSPSIWVSGVWPPPGIPYVDPFSIPFLNTVLLVSSGVTITYAHRAAALGSNKHIARGLISSIVYGLIFIFCQYYEYTHLTFNISDSVYGSIFYMLTGFHGMHVIIGLILLIACLFRLYHFYFRKENHLGLEVAIYYWHFVDVVWLFLYIFVYIWGAGIKS